MSPRTYRILGLVYMALAVIVSILNLKRVANLGGPAIPGILIILGALQFLRARRAEQKQQA